MVLIEVALHVLGTLEAEPVVQFLRTGVVGVAFDFDVGAVRLGLELLDELVDLADAVSGTVALPNLKLPLSSLSTTS